MRKPIKTNDVLLLLMAPEVVLLSALAVSGLIYLFWS